MRKTGEIGEVASRLVETSSARVSLGNFIQPGVIDEFVESLSSRNTSLKANF